MNLQTGNTRIGRRAGGTALAALAGLLLLPLTGLAAQEGRLYILLDEPAAIAVVDPAEGRLEATIALTGEHPRGLFPTPGGKFVFVGYRSSPLLSVVDFETQSETRVIDSLTFQPDALFFTPRGETLYVTHRDSNDIAVFDHRRSQLASQTEVRLGVAGGGISFNRRGTRLYRAGSRGLTYWVRKDYEEIRRAPRSDSRLNWAIDASFRFLWSAGADGLLIVDERRGRVTKRIPGSFAPVQPIFADGVAWLLGADGETLHAVNAKRFRLKATTELPTTIDSLAAAHGRLWGISRSDRALWSLATEEGGQQSRSALQGEPVAIAFIELKSGEGFACF